jgi:hypothetical protein
MGRYLFENWIPVGQRRGFSGLSPFLDESKIRAILTEYKLSTVIRVTDFDDMSRVRKTICHHIPASPKRYVLFCWEGREGIFYFAVVKNIRQLNLKRFNMCQCNLCEAVFPIASAYNATRHRRRCQREAKSGDCNIYFSGKVPITVRCPVRHYQPPVKLSRELETAGIRATCRELSYDYLIVFDIETYNTPMHHDRPVEDCVSLSFVSKHELCSIAVVSNVPGFESTRIFMPPPCSADDSDGPEFDPRTLAIDFVSYCLEVSEKARELYRDKIDRVLQDLERYMLDAEHCQHKGRLARLRNVNRAVEHFSMTIPVFGYNSGG